MHCNVVYIYSSFIRDANAKRANVFKCEDDKLIFHVQFNVNVKTSAHVLRLLIQKMKIDVKRIIRRRYADVALKFLNNQKIIFF